MKDKIINPTRPIVFLTSFTLIIILGSPLLLLAGICSAISEISGGIKDIYQSYKAHFYGTEEEE
jgi:hypothetical protein